MLDKTYYDTWNTRNSKLKFDNYSEYLKSEEWKKVKYKISKRPFYHKCYICNTKNNLEIHHRSYKWINTKLYMMNLVALCRNCHQLIHDISKDNNISVRMVTKKTRKIKKINPTLKGYEIKNIFNNKYKGG